jgi:hypothetical protein
MDFHDSKIETTMNRRTRPCLVKIGFKGGYSRGKSEDSSSRLFQTHLPKYHSLPL